MWKISFLFIGLCMFSFGGFGQKWDYVYENNEQAFERPAFYDMSKEKIQAKIYQSASLNDVFELRDIVQYVSIDTTDSFGNTALCLSVLQGNVIAFVNLRTYGADEQHMCMQRIPPKQKEQFFKHVKVYLGTVHKKSVYSRAGKKVRSFDRPLVYAPAKEESKSSKILLGTGLFALIGGGIALAAGGGGGGGGVGESNAPPVDETCEGSDTQDIANCNTYDTCTTLGGKTKYTCVACADGYTIENSRCFPSSNEQIETVAQTFKTDEFMMKTIPVTTRVTNGTVVSFLDLINAEYAYARGYTGYIMDRDSNNATLLESDENKQKIKIGVLDNYFAQNYDLKENIASTENFDYPACSDGKITQCYKKGTYTTDGEQLDVVYFVDAQGNERLVGEYYSSFDDFFDKPYTHDSTSVDYTDLDYDTEGMSTKNLSHGTHVAGIIGAVKNSDIDKNEDTKGGMHGIVPNSSLYLKSIEGHAGSPGKGYLFTMEQAFDSFIKDEVRVINLSIGIDGLGTADLLNGKESTITLGDEGETFPVYWKNAIKKAAKNEIVVVSAAGNDSQDNPSIDLGLPLTTDLGGILKDLYVAVVSVKDTAAYNGTETNDHTPEWELASYSNQCGVAKDYCIAAPGGEIRKEDDEIIIEDAIVSTAYSEDRDYAYTAMAGTSMAAPMVTGGIALLMSAYPHLTSQEVVRLLFKTADDLGETGVDEVYGNGVMNLKEATDPFGSMDLALTSIDDSSFDLTRTNTRLSNSMLTMPVSLRNRFLEKLPSSYTAFDALNRPYAYATSSLFKNTAGHKSRFFENDFLAFRHQKTQKVEVSDRTQFSFSNSVLGISNSLPYGHISFQHTTPSKVSFGFKFTENTLYGAEDYFKQNMEHPFFKFKEATGVNLGYQFGHNTQVKLNVLTGKNAFFEDEDNEDTYDNRMTAFSMDTMYKLKNKWQFGTSVGVLRENKSFLGMQAGGFFDVHKSDTYLLGAKIGYYPTKNISFEAGYWRGFTKPDLPLAYLSFSPIQSESFTLNASYTKGKHRFGFDAHAPMKIVKGKASLHLPIGRHPTQDIVYYHDASVSMKPEAREWIFSLFYQGNVSKDLEMQTKLGVRLNPEHQKNVKPDYFGLVNLNMNY